MIKRTGNSEFLTQLMYSKDIEKDMFSWLFKRKKKKAFVESKEGILRDEYLETNSRSEDATT